jgi:thiamine transport system substrate-binding protein
MYRTIVPAVLFALLATRAMPAAPVELRVLTHSSFTATQSVLDAFQKENNVHLQFSAGGDAGETLNKAILSKENPLADVLYGVDNTFMGRALAADILEPYSSPALRDVPKAFQLDPTNRLLPVDVGYVTLNFDRKYFSQRNLEVPRSLEDLTRPAYKGMVVVENPATSSPGLAFLLATVSRFGATGSQTWETYWAALRQNDVLVVNGWDDAYFNEFSAGGKGKRPIVVSYGTSPAYELYAATAPKPAEPPTGNIDGDGASFQQVEFVGILKGAKQPDLARKFVDFMLGAAFQADIPLQMWVYPARASVTLPDIFLRFAPIPARPSTMAPASIDAGRDSWIQKWTQIVLH